MPECVQAYGAGARKCGSMSAVPADPLDDTV